jgi:spore coat polysaccharide biosynthesis protein SpsF
LGTGKTNIKDKVPIGVDFDFVADRLPPPWKRTYPIGLDVEVCTREALDRAWREAEAPVDREHVMPYMYRGVVLEGSDTRLSTGRSPQGFRVAVLNSPYDYGSYRWTVDTADDLEFVRQIYRCFRGRSDFSWIDVLSIVHTHPEIVSINASIRHKSLEETDERTAGAES